jgi:hypothetical protein
VDWERSKSQTFHGFESHTNSILMHHFQFPRLNIYIGTLFLQMSSSSSTAEIDLYAILMNAEGEQLPQATRLVEISIVFFYLN